VLYRDVYQSTKRKAQLKYLVTYKLTAEISYSISTAQTAGKELANIRFKWNRSKYNLNT